MVNLVDETGQRLLVIDGILFNENGCVAAEIAGNRRSNQREVTHDSTPRISHTLHASLRFFL